MNTKNEIEKDIFLSFLMPLVSFDIGYSLLINHQHFSTNKVAFGNSYCVLLTFFDVKNGDIFFGHDMTIFQAYIKMSHKKHQVFLTTDSAKIK